MRNKNLNIVASALLAAGAIIPGTSAYAEDLPRTKAHQQLSVTQGFNESSLSVLQRVAPSDQNTVSTLLVAKLRPGASSQSAMVGNRLRTTGAQWSLEVTGDGTAAEYLDLAVAAQAHALGKPPSGAMSAADLEQRGRAYIASNLAGQIVLGADEELVALRTDYRTEGGQDFGTGAITQAVVANRIVFSRTLHGVPVVGNGSKVILTFTNDGSLESLRYDWPSYQASATQTVADAGQILARVQKAVAARNGVAVPRSGVAVPSRQNAASPVELTPNASLQTLDCGYYDAGSRARQTQSIQPGCTYLAVSQDLEGTRAGYAGAVPAGTQFTTDAAWPETLILGKQ